MTSIILCIPAASTPSYNCQGHDGAAAGYPAIREIPDKAHEQRGSDSGAHPWKLPRPQRLPSTTYELPTNCGKIYITVTTDSDGLPFEIFARFGKAGSCGAAIFDGLTKIVSYALRSVMDPADAVKAFSGISCSHGRNTCLNAASAALKEGPGRSPL